MKVIFLDIDGVLNESASETRSPTGFLGIDDEKVQRLKRIVEETGAEIVLTSSWKTEWDPDPEKASADGNYLSKKLADHGLRILEKTDDMHYNRGEGISTWLNQHPSVTSWVVLDDDIFADYKTFGILPHLVKTMIGNGGLKQSHVNLCVHQLNAQVYGGQA